MFHIKQDTAWFWFLLLLSSYRDLKNWKHVVFPWGKNISTERDFEHHQLNILHSNMQNNTMVVSHIHLWATCLHIALKCLTFFSLLFEKQFVNSSYRKSINTERKHCRKLKVLPEMHYRLKGFSYIFLNKIHLAQVDVHRFSEFIFLI